MVYKYLMLCLVVFLSSCVSVTNTVPEPAQLEELLKQNLVVLSDNDFEKLPASLKENEIMFVGEVHKVKPLANAAGRLAVYLATHKSVVYALETCYGDHLLFEAVSMGEERPINPTLYPANIRTFNSNQTEDKKILLTAIDIEHRINYSDKKGVKHFLQDLAGRSTSETSRQAIEKEVDQLVDQDTFDKMNRYLKKLKQVFQRHFDTFSAEDRDEILFSMELIKASNRYHQYKSAGGLTASLHRPWDIRNKYFIKTVKRAYKKAQKRDAILLCRVGAFHARLDIKLEARYFAKKYSPTKGRVASINMVPLYYDGSETNDTEAGHRNDIDSIVKVLMKDDEYSYLSLSELQQNTNNSFRWNKYYSSNGPKYDGLLFVRVEK